MRTRLYLTAGIITAATGLFCGESLASPRLTLDKVLGDPAFRHSSSLIDIVPLPDAKRILTSGNDGSARLWDLESGEELYRYVHQSKGYIWDICLEPGAGSFITTAHSGRVVRWDLRTGKQATVCALTNNLFSAAISPDGKFLAAAGENECVIWDIHNNRRHAGFGTDDKEEAYAAVFLNQGEMVMAGFDENGAIVKKLSDMSTVFELPKNCEGVYRLIPSPDNARVLACTAKRGLVCIDAETFAVKWEALAGRASMYAAAWSPDRKLVAVSYHGGEGDAKRYLLTILDSQTGKIMRTVPIHQRNNHYGMAFSTDGKHVLCSSGNTLCKIDANTGRRVFPSPDQSFRNDGIEWLVSPPSVDSILISHEGNGLLMLDPDDGTEEGVWHKESKFDNPASSPDSRFFAGSASSPSSVTVIDFKTDQTVARIDPPNSAYALTLADSGRALLAETYSGITVYGLPSGDPLGRANDLSGLDADVTASQLSGPLVAFADKGEIRVIDTKHGEGIGSMSLPGTVRGLAFYPARGPALIAAAGTNLYLWAPETSRSEASERSLKKAVSRLASRKFRDREDATDYLIAQGPAALEAIKAADTNDPEVKDRITRIRREIVAENIYGQSTDILPTRFKSFSALASHPSHPFWFALSGHPSDTTLVMGDVKEGKLRLLFEIRDPNSPSFITFDPDGDLLTGNRNGTISRYGLKKE